MDVIVYTVLIGTDEELNEQPVAPVSESRFVCLTDHVGIKSETWEIETVEPSIFADPHRSSRDLKLRGYERFGKNVVSLYIDNTVILEQDPVSLLQEWLQECSIAMMQHTFRKTVADEFDACIAYRLDHAARIREQLVTYKSTIPKVLAEQPLWGGLIARRHDREADRFTQEWMNHVLRYSRRDQLSVNAARHLSNARICIIPGSISESAWHRWPQRTPAAPLHRSIGKAGPLRKFWYLRITPRLRGKTI